jgi:alkylhydroperoxidase family enzyme
MDRIAPATPAHFDQISDHMERWKKSKGYPPNTWYTMARKPAVFRAYRDLHGAVMMGGGEVPQGLKFMLAAVTSTATGDSYCAAHNAENAHHIAGVPLDKIRALANFRSDPQFTPAERAALELGDAAGAHPPHLMARAAAGTPVRRLLQRRRETRGRTTTLTTVKRMQRAVRRVVARSAVASRRAALAAAVIYLSLRVAGRA